MDYHYKNYTKLYHMWRKSAVFFYLSGFQKKNQSAWLHQLPELLNLLALLPNLLLATSPGKLLVDSSERWWYESGDNTCEFNMCVLFAYEYHLIE